MFFNLLGMPNGADESIGHFSWSYLLPVTIGYTFSGAGLVGGIYGWLQADRQTVFPINPYLRERRPVPLLSLALICER